MKAIVKVRVVAGSVVVSIPRTVLKDSGLKPGRYAIIQTQYQGGGITVRPVKP